MTPPSLATAVTVARALGHPARLRVVAMLGGGELCVCQITEVLGLAQSTVSTHLRELKRAGLVRERKEGRWVFFALSPEPAAAPWLAAALAAASGDPRVAADGLLVAELRALPVADLCRLGYLAAKAKTGLERECGSDRSVAGGRR